jgi:hypothetical protein
MRGRIVAIALCGTVLLAACGRGGDQAGGAPAAGAASTTGGTAAAGGDAAARATTSAAPTGEARARAIRDAAAAWPKVEGRWTRGAADSRYVAYFDGGELRYLVEDATLGDGGTRRQQYWFDAGELWYYVGEKPSAYGGTGPGALPPSVPIVAEFRGAEVVRAVSREHYGEKKLDDEAVRGIRAQAAALAGAAQDEWSAVNAK